MEHVVIKFTLDIFFKYLALIKQVHFVADERDRRLLRTVFMYLLNPLLYLLKAAFVSEVEYHERAQNIPIELLRCLVALRVEHVPYFNLAIFRLVHALRLLDVIHPLDVHFFFGSILEVKRHESLNERRLS